MFSATKALIWSYNMGLGGQRGAVASLCLGWPDRSRNVSPYFLGHPDRIGPKGVVTMLVEIA